MKSSESHLLGCLSALGMMMSSLVLAAEPSFMGVIEEPQCYRESKLEKRVVRVMFVKKEGTWQIIQPNDLNVLKDSMTRTWKAYSDGKMKGIVRTRIPIPEIPAKDGWLFYRDWVLPIDDKVPAIANTNSFSGWCGKPTSRPMVVSPRTTVADPAGWKPLQASIEYKKKLLDPFRIAVGRVNFLNCANEEARPRSFSVQVQDLRLYRAFVSNDKRKLIAIGLDPDAYRCDGPSGSAWSPHWFLLTHETVDYIGNSLELVDSGDFDGDGQSEILFWHSDYNRDGYVLLVNDLAERLDYTWSYH